MNREKKLKRDVEKSTDLLPQIDFAWLQCPHCKGTGYGSWESGLAAITCQICNGIGRLITCYTCEAVKKIRSDAYRSYCMGCTGKLSCDKHSWEEIPRTGFGDTKVSCSICKIVKSLHPKGFCGQNHNWQITSEGAACKVCGVKADL